MIDNRKAPKVLEKYQEVLKVPLSDEFESSFKLELFDKYNTYYNKNMQKKHKGLLRIFFPSSKLMYFSLMLVALIGFLSPLGYLYFSKSDTIKDSKYVATSPKALLTQAHGEVLLGSTQIEEDFELRVGDVISSKENSLAEISLSDGSFLRINEDTEVEILNLSENEYEFLLIKGEAYARVTESTQRSYSIQTQNYNYTALGTAFQVSQIEKESKLVVFHSSVKVTDSDFDSVVEEGQELIDDGEVTEISVEDLDRKFIAFNKRLDAKDFSDELGFLEQLVFDDKDSDILDESESESENAPQDNNDSSQGSNGGQPQNPAPNPAPAPNPDPTPDPTPSYPTGPTSYFSNVFPTAYAEFDEWKNATGYTCASTLANITTSGGVSIEIWNCGATYYGKTLAVQYVPGYGGVPNGAYLVVPILISPYAPGLPFTDPNSVYKNTFSNPYTGPNGNTIRYASDGLIDYLLSVGVL